MRGIALTPSLLHDGRRETARARFCAVGSSQPLFRNAPRSRGYNWNPCAVTVALVLPAPSAGSATAIV